MIRIVLFCCLMAFAELGGVNMFLMSRFCVKVTSKSRKYMSTVITNDLPYRITTRASPDSFSVAPMMDYTDRHQRYFQRLLTRYAVLYTEMVTAQAIVYRHKNGERQRDMETNDPIEQPVVLQLGGADYVSLRDAARIAARSYNYTTMNLNVGCPSEKVAGSGCFGARLMLDPSLVSQLVCAIRDGSGHPVSVKCRIGVNDKDEYEDLHEFVDHVSRYGSVDHFIIHARKAILDARFSPEDNRRIPPLKYDYVYYLIRDFPHLKFSINGGIATMEDVQKHLDQGVEGVMVGRSAVNNPFAWRNVDSMVYGKQDPGYSRREILINYANYAAMIERTYGPRVRSILVKPVLNIFANASHTKQFKQKISELLPVKLKSEAKYSVSEIILISSLENGISDSILDAK